MQEASWLDSTNSLMQITSPAFNLQICPTAPRQDLQQHQLHSGLTLEIRSGIGAKLQEASERHLRNDYHSTHPPHLGHHIYILSRSINPVASRSDNSYHCHIQTLQRRIKMKNLIAKTPARAFHRLPQEA